MKFIVDGVYRCDPGISTKIDTSGAVNNVLKIKG